MMYMSFMIATLSSSEMLRYEPWWTLPVSRVIIWYRSEFELVRLFSTDEEPSKTQQSGGYRSKGDRGFRFGAAWMGLACSLLHSETFRLPKHSLWRPDPGAFRMSRALCVWALVADFIRRQGCLFILSVQTSPSAPSDGVRLIRIPLRSCSSNCQDLPHQPPAKSTRSRPLPHTPHCSPTHATIY